jgi:hypothetical protein
LHKLAMGEPARPIELRSGDFGTDLAQEFNAVLRRVNELEAKLNATSGDAKADRAADTATSQAEPQSPEPRVVTTADADSALELLNQI